MTIEAVWGDGVPKPKMAYSPAIRAGDWLFVAGQLASDFATGVPSGGCACQRISGVAAGHPGRVRARQHRRNHRSDRTRNG